MWCLQPVSLLLWWWPGKQFYHAETVCSGMLIHIVCLVAHMPTVWNATHHTQVEVEPDMIVKCLVALGSVLAHRAVPMVHFSQKRLSIEHGRAIPLNLVHRHRAYNAV